MKKAKTPTTPDTQPDFSELGLLVEQVLIRFYTKVFADPMIGFFFKKSNLAHLVQKETGFVLQGLGKENAYAGRELRGVHTPFKIRGGHFDRRYVLLKETLEEMKVAESIREAWLSHTRAFREHVVMSGPGGEKECSD